MSEYRKLNLDKLTFSDEIVSYEDALRGVTPLKVEENSTYPEKIKITKAERDYKNKCVKLEISCWFITQKTKDL